MGIGIATGDGVGSPLSPTDDVRGVGVGAVVMFRCGWWVGAGAMGMGVGCGALAKSGGGGDGGGGGGGVGMGFTGVELT